MGLLLVFAQIVAPTVIATEKNKTAGEETMGNYRVVPCRFDRVEPDGNLIMDVEGYKIRATLTGIEIRATTAAQANAYLAERTPRVDMRCTVNDTSPPHIIEVEFLAWRDKSGDV